MGEEKVKRWNWKMERKR